MNFIVLSSSRGTTFQAVLNALANGTLGATCLGLISDSEERQCVEKVRRAGLPVWIVEKKKGEPREQYDRRIAEYIPSTTTIIACIGWLHILSPWFVKQWKNRILNVHPSLLPKYPGLHAHEEILRAGEKESGMTIHIVTEGLDKGPVLIQKKCPVLPDDTVETLKARVQELEKEWYPKMLQMIEEGSLKLP